MGQEKFTLTENELRRYKVIQSWVSGDLNGYRAATILNLSYRQVLRLKKNSFRKG